MYRPRNSLTERVRDLVFRAVQRIPGGRDYVLQMKYKPMPRYTQGVVVGVVPSDKNDPVGRMFVQPDVEVNGQRMRLDDTLGPWFAIVWLRVDVRPADAEQLDAEPLEAESLDAETLAWWQGIGAHVVRVRRPPGRLATSSISTERSAGGVRPIQGSTSWCFAPIVMWRRRARSATWRR